MTALADGNFIVTWTSADGATEDIKSQVFDPQVYAGRRRGRPPSTAARMATI